MTRRSKKVQILCYTPFWKYSQISVPWQDVWVTFQSGRKKKSLSLTLQNCGEIDKQISDIEKQNEYMRKVTLENYENPTPVTVRHKDGEETFESLDGWLGLNFTLEEQLELYKDENTDWLDLQWIREYFKDYDQDFGLMMCTNNTYGDFEPVDNGDYFYLLVNRPTLNKKDVEDAVEWFLKNFEGVGQVNLNFNWKRTKTWVMPC